MALTATALSTLIQTELGQLGSGDSATDAQYIAGSKKLADAIANAVVTALTTQAQVVIPTGAVAVTGSAAAQTNPAPVIGQIQ